MTGACRGDHPSLGVYVLGALAPGERAEFEAHLGGCAACRDELAALAGLPGLLARVHLEEVERAVPPPPDPGAAERILTAIRRRRTRRRRVAAALAAGAALLVAVVAGVRVLPSGGTEPFGRTLTASASPGGVSGEVTLRPAAVGTGLTVRMRGVVPGSRCRMTVVAVDGRREAAGTWRASYEGEAAVQSVTQVPLADIRAVEIRTDGGQVLRVRL